MGENQNGRFSVGLIAQALLVAAITATATGYVSAKVLESKVDYLVQELRRIDVESKEARSKLDEVTLRQSRAIGQADLIHDLQNRRLERLEVRR